jgi:hypothetical protein
MAVRLSALRAHRTLPPGRFLVLISVRGWVHPTVIVSLGGLGQLKTFPSSGIRFATFRVVAQCHNQLHYHVQDKRLEITNLENQQGIKKNIREMNCEGGKCKTLA